MYDEQCRSAEGHFFPGICVTYMQSCWPILPFNPDEYAGSFEKKTMQTWKFLEGKEWKDVISGIIQNKTELISPTNYKNI